jgi:Flp pilus assembly protein TadD
LLLGYASGGGVERLAGGRLHFEAGLARNPADARLARVLQRLDDEARAVTTRSPGTAGEWLRQGLALLDLGRPEAALQCFDRAVGLEPLAREARYNRLLALARLGRAEAAAGIVAFTRDFPGDARGWSQLAQRQAESGDLEAALASVRRAIAIDPSTASFWNNLAVTLVRLGRHEEAGAAFVRAHDLDPGFPEAAYHAAVSYSLAGRTLEAASWVAVCLERRLCDPTRFLTEAHFANLRASPQWRQERVERAAAAWNGGAP